MLHKMALSSHRCIVFVSPTMATCHPSKDSCPVTAPERQLHEDGDDGDEDGDIDNNDEDDNDDDDDNDNDDGDHEDDNDDKNDDDDGGELTPRSMVMRFWHEVRWGGRGPVREFPLRLMYMRALQLKKCGTGPESLLFCTPPPKWYRIEIPDTVPPRTWFSIGWMGSLN